MDVFIDDSCIQTVDTVAQMSAWFKLLVGRISVSTRSRAEIVGEGRGDVRAEARAPSRGLGRGGGARLRRRLGFGTPTPEGVGNKICLLLNCSCRLQLIYIREIC
jgi:hypothetical protein